MVMFSFTSGQAVALTTILASGVTASKSPSHYVKYSTVAGYFQQDDPNTNASTFDYVSLRQPFS